jgi:hypothetical protein
MVPPPIDLQRNWLGGKNICSTSMKNIQTKDTLPGIEIFFRKKQNVSYHTSLTGCPSSLLFFYLVNALALKY